MEWLIQLSSNEEDIVLDPFMGSGTTAVASINKQRQFIGFEIDATYCDLSNRRIQNIVQKPNKITFLLRSD